MFSILSRTLRLVAARWPQLLAWYLAGWLGRYLLIQLAATIGAHSALGGLLILPLAVLARLGSFIAMFLVLRTAMPAFTDLRDRGENAIDTTGARGGRERVQDIFLVSILPFFAFYAAWQFLAADTTEYQKLALAKIDFVTESVGSGRVIDLQFGVLSVSVIVAAFLGRYLIKRYSARLPRWSTLVAVYLEAAWVFLTLFFIAKVQRTVNDWIVDRAVVYLYTDVKEAVSAAIAPVGWVWSWVDLLLREAGALVLLPLAWLALAGVVYGRALAKPTVQFVPRNRYYAGVRSRVTVLPKGVLRRAKDLGNDVMGRWTPLYNAALLIWRAGVLPMGLFVLAYTVIEAAASWLMLAGIHVIGPHDLYAWWMNFDNILGFVVDVLLEPLRICLIAAAYNYCLHRLEERRDADATAEGEGIAVAQP